MEQTQGLTPEKSLLMCINIKTENVYINMVDNLTLKSKHESPDGSRISGCSQHEQTLYNIKLPVDYTKSLM
jgi:hypothetical protein